MLFIERHTNPISSLVLYIPVLHTCCLYVCIRWYPVAAWNNRNKRLIEWTELRTPTNTHSKRFCYFSCHVASNGMKNSMDLLVYFKLCLSEVRILSFYFISQNPSNVSDNILVNDKSFAATKYMYTCFNAFVSCGHCFIRACTTCDHFYYYNLPVIKILFSR